MTYKFKYKKLGDLFWKTKTVKGHCIDYNEEQILQNKVVIQVFKKPLDAMVLFFEDGGAERIPEWSKYKVLLGPDWKLATNESMDKDAGQAVK